MQLIQKMGRWGTALTLLFAASWVGFLGYMAQGFAEQWPHAMEGLPQKASLATNSIAGNWWVLWLFAALTLMCAVIVVLKREVPLLLAAIVAGALLLSASVFNVVVVSAGFEMSALENVEYVTSAGAPNDVQKAAAFCPRSSFAFLNDRFPIWLRPQRAHS